MAYNFSVQKVPTFGSYGEFSIGPNGSKVRAHYLLTKIRPGQSGSPENQLATHMAPWREIFSLEELHFDELIQRDLDDSRVAHDLIPYLLGDTGQHARFFPPVLAVLVPKQENRSGIAPRYPTPESNGDKISFGELFSFEKLKIDGEVSPLGAIQYNPQRSAFVIVDGQHRAMAILALHRQINKSWGADPFAPYYSHIQLDAEEVAHIELPVCIIYFPDLHEGQTDFKEKGIDLVSVCREVFIAVNRQAKQVSKSRELLLDDEDFAAFMMRRTLTQFKDRNSAPSTAARIYSFAFGDSEADNSSQVMAGQLEFCSAVTIHKMHAAVGFAVPAAFNLTKTADVTDGRNVRNAARPAEILTGLDEVTASAISRRSAKTRKPVEVDFIANKIGALTDSIMLPLFDNLRPYAAHNQATRDLLVALNDSNSRADPVQAKCRSLLFDGAGNRHVFEEHFKRINEKIEELNATGQDVPSNIAAQLIYCKSVSRALSEREDEIKANRANILFNIDVQNFSKRDPAVVEADLRELRARGKAVSDALATQAFQLGYLMAVISHAEKLLPDAAAYDDRLATIKFVSHLYLDGLNCFFAVGATKHRTLNGYVSEPRARAFEASQMGFRGLLAATNVRELNEKQWEFFRYMILEIVHSKMASEAVLGVLNMPQYTEQAARFRKQVPNVTADIETLRNKYFEAAVRTAHQTPDFRREVGLLEMEATTKGKSADEIKLIVEAAVAEKRKATIEVCKAHLKASLGTLASPAQMRHRLAPSAEAIEVSEGVIAGPELDAAQADQSNLAASVAADNLQHSSSKDEGGK